MRSRLPASKLGLRSVGVQLAALALAAGCVEDEPGWPTGPLTDPVPDDLSPCVQIDEVVHVDFDRVPLGLPSGTLIDGFQVRNVCTHAADVPFIQAFDPGTETIATNVRVLPLLNRRLSSGGVLDMTIVAYGIRSDGPARAEVRRLDTGALLAVVDHEVTTEPMLQYPLPQTLGTTPDCPVRIETPLHYAGRIPLELRGISPLGSETWSARVEGPLPVVLSEETREEPLLVLELDATAGPATSQWLGLSYDLGARRIDTGRAITGVIGEDRHFSIGVWVQPGQVEIPLSLVPEPDSLSVTAQGSEVDFSYDAERNVVRVEALEVEDTVLIHGVPACL